MGLYVSRRFVELMGGRVAVHSSPGQGTDAVVLLRAAGEALRPPRPADAAGRPSPAA
jgi:signal transduction histidine kinase